MGWQQRGQKRYYYNNVWKGGRSVRTYLGSGDAAELAATADALRRVEREIDARKWQQEQERRAAAEALLIQLCEQADRLVRGTLLAAGFQQHARGSWRYKKEVESGEKSVKRKASEVRQRQENNKSGNQTSAEKPGPEQEEPQPEAEATLTRKEWKTCIQTLKHTLLLDFNNLPSGETRDRVERFQRALQEKTISKKARKQMKSVVAELLERCQEVLRLLE